VRVLIAEDDIVTATVVSKLLRAADYDVTIVGDGPSALAALADDNPPEVALVDWMLPGIDGPDICAAMRRENRPVRTYLILLTARSSHEDVVRGLEAGADDYLVKPFNPEELRARVKAGMRIATLQQKLTAHVEELQAALASVKTLSGLLPICGYCNSIRDDDDYWYRVEEYVAQHTDAQFSHGICPTCLKKVLPADTIAS
jgi:phosphoserine phosphatase RsbU/P